jgi:glycosyltransferase involved in cell wall biosynthesis
VDLVSIIIPCYKQAHYLPDAIESCLAQTYTHIEIIVVDDGSPDNTGEVAARYTEKYPNVRYVRQDNAGVSAARNTGIAHAQGLYLKFLDSDDLLLPQHVQRCMDWFAQNPQFTAVYTNYEVRSSDLSQHIASDKFAVPLTRMMFNLLKGWMPSQLNTVLVHRDQVAKTGGFPVGIKGGEDWFFWMSLLAYGTQFGFINEVLAVYRRHKTNTTNDIIMMDRQLLDVWTLVYKLPIAAALDMNLHIGNQHERTAQHLWSKGRRTEARAEYRHALRLLSASQTGKNRRFRLWMSILLSYLVDVRTVRKWYGQLKQFIKQPTPSR